VSKSALAAASYAADLDAGVEDQDVLNTVRAATRLRGELREELRGGEGEGSGTGGTEEEYVHRDDADLDDNIDVDDLAYLELPTDEEAGRAEGADGVIRDVAPRRVCSASHCGREKGGGGRPGRDAPKRAPIGIPPELGGDGRGEGISGDGRAEGGSGGTAAPGGPRES
jgi:hypothetical protein